MNGCGKSHPHRDSIPRPSSKWQVAMPTELFRPTHNKAFKHSVGKTRRFKIANKKVRHWIRFRMIFIQFPSSKPTSIRSILLPPPPTRLINPSVHQLDIFRICCDQSVRNLLSSRLLSKNLKIEIYRTITLPVVLYVCET